MSKLLESQFVFTENVSILIATVFDSGYKCTLGEAFRTKEQAEIYAKEGKGIVNSQHCKRLSIDINLFDKDGVYLTDTESYKFLGDYWKSLNPNNRWGGDFTRKDGNHFEMKE